MSKQLQYLPKLDSLRAIAALMVLVSHYMVDVGGPDFRYGGNGVQVFFVISGFLITTILLSQKQQARLPKIRLLGNFIVKRALRLFPVYYLLLSVLVVMSVAGGLWLCKPGGLIYYFTYTQNYFFFTDGFQSPLFNHTWSLAVEEQFYLFWPLLILFVPKRLEFMLLVLVFLSGFFFKFFFMHYVSTPGTIKGVTFIHLDTLGAGALIAYGFFYYNSILARVQKHLAFIVLLLTLPATVLMTYYRISEDVFLPLLLVLMSSSLVLLCASPFKTPIDLVLNSRLLRNIGKISYGVYLYHKIVPFFFQLAWSKAGLPPVTNAVVLFVLYTAIALGISALSWRILESRILKLKDKFDI